MFVGESGRGGYPRGPPHRDDGDPRPRGHEDGAAAGHREEAADRGGAGLRQRDLQRQDRDHHLQRDDGHQHSHRLRG